MNKNMTNTGKGLNKKNCFFILLCILSFLCACDKSHEQNQIGTLGSESIHNGLVILNNLGESMSVLDPDKNMHNRVQITGRCPNDIVEDSGYLYIVNSLSNSILVLNADTLSLVKEISLGVNKNPYHLAVVRKGIVAVTELQAGTLDIVDIERGLIIESIDLKKESWPEDLSENFPDSFCYPHGVAVNKGHIFVTLANLTAAQGGLTAAGHSMVVVINAYSLRIEKYIEINGWDAVFADSIGSKVIVACAGHYTGNISAVDPGGFDGDGSIIVIDAEDLEVDKTYQMENTAPFGFSLGPDNILYTSNAFRSDIGRCDLNAEKVISSLRIDMDTQYISDILCDESGLYLLGFNNDELYLLGFDGHLINRWFTGDGPIDLMHVDGVAAEKHLVPVMDINPTMTSPGKEIRFDASQSINTAGDIVCTWEFGDGKKKTGMVVTHAYNESGTGTYTVCLSCVDALGNVAACESTVEIKAHSPFASEVIEYNPAPGQFIKDNSIFTIPSKALGPPVGGGPNAPNNSSQVSLGAFGGSITLKFDHRVLDNTEEEGKYDFIVFGNALVSGGERFVEPGIVEICDSEELDGNEKWYLIPGSSLEPADEDPRYARQEQVYDTGTFAGYRLPDDIQDEKEDGIYTLWGYADMNPVAKCPDTTDPAVFYTVPDLPGPGFNGSGGGDAFDIAWAVDPDTGEPADLDGFRYIRITTAVLRLDTPTGEISTEIDAVSDIITE
ncbi:MAG: PKD domain-containing protein [Thermodesulfobacteriota bacterium]|nr:PKD domain-containing protein [Thermodesulfobacteriota bacterium]